MGLGESEIRYLVKETVRVMSSDPHCKDDNARFKTLPLKYLSDQVSIKNAFF